MVVDAKAKRARIWNEGSDGAIELGEVFQHDNGLYLARVGVVGSTPTVEVFKLKADASGKEARHTVPVCDR